MYDPASGEFAPAASMHAMRFKIGAAVAKLLDGGVLVAGSDETVKTFDPTSVIFRLSTGPVDAEYQFATATTLSDGRVLTAGGYDPAIRPTANTWIFEP